MVLKIIQYDYDAATEITFLSKDKSSYITYVGHFYSHTMNLTKRVLKLLPSN